MSIVFLNKGGVPAGGRLLVTKRRDKTSVCATSCGGGGVSPCDFSVWKRR